MYDKMFDDDDDDDNDDNEEEQSLKEIPRDSLGSEVFGTSFSVSSYVGKLLPTDFPVIVYGRFTQS